MFIAACLHKYTFGYETYKNGTIKSVPQEKQGQSQARAHAEDGRKDGPLTDFLCCVRTVRLLMDQRAFFLAQKSYQRAVAQARYRENAARIEAGLPPLPVEGAVVTTVLPAGTDVLGASDATLAAARADAPAPAGSAAQVDVKLVRVRSACGSDGGDGSSGTPLGASTTTEISVQPAAAAAEELARAGYHADSDDEGDALFDFDQNETSTGGMGFEARVDRQQRAQAGMQRPAMQRAQSSIQLSVRRSARGGSFGGGGSVDDDDADNGGGGGIGRGAKGLPRVSSLSSLRQSAPPGFAAPNRPGPGPFIGGPVSFSPSPSPRTASDRSFAAAAAATAIAAAGHAHSHAHSHHADVSDSDPYPSESDFHDSDINDTGGGLYR